MKDHPYMQLKGFLTFLILHELGQRGLCGDDLASKIGARKGGKLTPGTIYPALKELRKKKLIRYKKFGRKKIYTLSDEGKNELKLLYKLFSKYFFGLKQYIKREAPVKPEIPKKTSKKVAKKKIKK